MYDMAKTLTVRIDSKLEKRLAKLARARGVSEGQVVRDLLDGGLAVAELRALQAEAEPYARAAGYVTDEDVFRDIS